MTGEQRRRKGVDEKWRTEGRIIGRREHEGIVKTKSASQEVKKGARKHEGGNTYLRRGFVRSNYSS